MAEAWYPDPRAALQKRRATSREALEALNPDELSAKDATRLLKQALKNYGSQVKVAQNELSDAVKEYSRTVNERDAQVGAAGTGREISRYGGMLIKHLVLFEDRLKTLTGEIRLTPDMKARIEVEGQLQSVQGWTFKGTKDLRDVFLHLEGEKEAKVVKLPIKGSTASGGSRSSIGVGDASAKNTTERVRSFAQQIELAARRAPETAIEIKERQATAFEALADSWDATDGMDHSLARLDAIASDTTAIDDRCQLVLQVAERLDEKDRGKKKLPKVVGDVERGRDVIAASARERIQNFPSEVPEKGDRSDSFRAKAQKLRKEAMADRKTLSSGKAAAATSAAGGSGGDRIAQLKDLGELRDSGVLTDDEFAAEKARILGGE